MKSNSKSKSNITLEDFVAYLPAHTYIFLPTREPWPASSVDSQFPFGVALLDDKGKPVLDKKGKPTMIAPSRWLDLRRPVQQMTWAPGLPMLIRDRFVGEGGWIERPGATVLNLYRPPQLTFGKGSKAKVKPWLGHMRKIYPNDADHIVKWLAQRVQQPQEKINHALMLGGNQGIGKDTLLAPLKDAVGAWNFIEITPAPMFGRFNGFVKSVILRISEVRDLGDTNRFVFYEHMKTYTAAPPEVLRCDEKNLREHAVLNVCGVIITTNYKTDGLYLPADDRRTYVAWSDCEREEFSKTYWQELWGWYEDGGTQHVANYLAGLDLSECDAKAPPPKTPAFWAIVDAHRAPEESELADIFDKLGNPDVVTLNDVFQAASYLFGKWLEDRKHRRTIPHRFASVGYVPVRNSASKQGVWSIDGERQVVYAKSTLPLRDQLAAVATLQRSRESAAKPDTTKPNGGSHAR